MAFKCFFLCHWDYRGIRRQARKLAAGGKADPVALKALWDGGHARCAERAYGCVAELQGLWVHCPRLTQRISLSLSPSVSLSLSLSLLVPQRWRIDGNDESGKCPAAPRGHLDANAGMSVPAAKGHLNVVLLF